MQLPGGLLNNRITTNNRINHIILASNDFLAGIIENADFITRLNSEKSILEGPDVVELNFQHWSFVHKSLDSSHPYYSVIFRQR